MENTAKLPNGERRQISIKLWPPSENTRVMLVERMTNNLSTPTIFTRKYGSLGQPEAAKYAKQIEESAFSSANQHYEQEPAGDGSAAVQLYAKECSKLILEVLKGGAKPEEKEALNSEVESAPRETFFDISKGAADVAGPILASILNQLKEVDLSDFVAERPEAEALDVMNIFSETLEGSHLKYRNISDNALGEKGVRAFGKLLQSQILAIALNPQRNKFPFADQAFRLFVNVWGVLSNPTKRSLYDKEISFYSQPPSLPPLPIQQPDRPRSSIGPKQRRSFFISPVSCAQEGFSAFAGNAAEPAQNYSGVDERATRNLNVSDNVGEKADEDVEEEDEVEMEVEVEEMEAARNDDGLPFWTACPYCYYMYEYPNLYADCTLRCQNCKKAFQAVAIPSPPPLVDGQQGYFCCWGFLPFGFSMENWEKNKGAASTWTPFSPMFTCPGDGKSNTRKKNPQPRIYIDDDEDEDFVEVSDSSGSDDNWNRGAGKRRKKSRVVRGKGASVTPRRSARNAQVDKGKNLPVQDDLVPPTGVEAPNKTAGDSSKKVPATTARKQPARVAKNFEKLDLNVEFSNEAEEPAPRVNQGNGPSRGEDDNIGFFEGLDEFLSSLPILNVVGDDKVVKAS